jgi:MarR family transcriptional regulator, organic hydroperoxide resistance regulator
MTQANPRSKSSAPLAKKSRSKASPSSSGSPSAGSLARSPTNGSPPALVPARSPTSAPDFPLSPALDFLQRLWQLNHALEKLSSQMEKRIGVTAPQRMIIRCIGKYPGMAPSQLATVLHLDPGTISATLSRLEDKGFVVRRRDRDDKRRVSLGLTTKGRKLDAPVRGTVENGMERLLAGAIPGDISAARKLLEHLTGVLQDELEATLRREATAAAKSTAAATAKAAKAAKPAAKTAKAAKPAAPASAPARKAR